MFIKCKCGKKHSPSMSFEMITGDLIIFDVFSCSCKLPNNENWKKYPEEKPDEDQNCLVYCEGCGIDVAHKAYFSNGFFYSLEVTNSFPLLVTHWMSLPIYEERRY